MTTPVEVVDRQVAAYNARDARAFAATYSQDAVIRDGSGAVVREGRAQIERDYGALFDREPGLAARVVDRMTLSRWVVDREEVTGLASGQALDAVAVYDVVDGLIVSVTLLHG